jgi:potassium-transporting ATPase KdpC subunit
MKSLVTAFKVFFIITILTGVLYPLLITGLSQALFYNESMGSLVKEGNVIKGSKIIGQTFDSAIYFSSRPSAINYNPLPSGGTNLSYTDSRLVELFNKRRNEFILDNHLDSNIVVPSEMLFASASGLDPHISPQSALLQAERVAAARNFNSEKREVLLKLIKDKTEKPQFMCFGDERVNVLLLNLEVDKLK